MMTPFGVAGGFHSTSTAKGLTATTVTFSGGVDGTTYYEHRVEIY